MDGVLADASQRQHFLDGPFQYWEKFFAACGADDPIAEALELARLLDPALAVILLTARPIRVRAQTVDWLGRHPVRWDLLVMRDAGDYDDASQFKGRTVHELRDVGIHPELAFEDDRRNVAMFRSLDIPCVYIHSGYYD